MIGDNIKGFMLYIVVRCMYFSTINASTTARFACVSIHDEKVKPVLYGPSQYCCNGTVFDKVRNGKEYSCCNNEHYDVRMYICDEILRSRIMPGQPVLSGNQMDVSLTLNGAPPNGSLLGSYEVIKGQFLLRLLRKGSNSS